MLDQEAMQIARNRLNAESLRRDHLFRDELQQVQSELAIKGLAHSGVLIRAVTDVCAQEIENATERLWEIIRDLLWETDAAPSTEAVETLYRQIDELWVPYCSAGPEGQFEAICRRDGTDLLSMKNATNFGNRSIGARMRILSVANC